MSAGSGSLPPPSPAPAVTPSEADLDLRREALTMALYVAVCLLAAVIAVPEQTEPNGSPGPLEHAHAVGLVWGVALGLVLAHLFAFRVSSRLVALGRLRSADLRSAGAQLAGGGAVAVVATVPLVVVPESHELLSVELTMAALVALAGYGVARRSGSGRPRALVYAAVLVLLAVGIAVVKNHWAGH